MNARLGPRHIPPIAHAVIAKEGLELLASRDVANVRLALFLKYCLSAVFFGLGGWCLILPGMVETLSLRPEYHHLSATTALMMGCFGAQAILVGSLALLARFSSSTFLWFGLLTSIPFFVFNWWFVFEVKMFTPLMLLDFAGNISFFLIGLAGWRLLRGTDVTV